MDKAKTNELLNEIAEELNISDSTYEKAVASYSALGEYLNNHSDYPVDIYPQGSIRLGTAIKPINEDDDYDIDLVCRVRAQFHDAKNLKHYIGDILKASDRYSKMLDDEGRRCWTLKYAEDAHFHMDVLPAQKDNKKEDDSILITDKKDGIYSFKSSNPKGYAKWFDQIAILDSGYHINSIDPIKNNVEKSTLQKTIQLLKRHRDIMYSSMSDEENEDKPISVIITTIAAKLFTGKENVLEMLEKFSNSWTSCFEEDSYGNEILKNPVDPSENFADKWIEEPSKKISFVFWAKKLKDDLDELNLSSFDGKVKEAENLKRLFGATVVESVYSRRVNKIGSPYINRTGNTIGITDKKTDTPVKKHTFYGED